MCIIIYNIWIALSAAHAAHQYVRMKTSNNINKIENLYPCPVQMVFCKENFTIMLSFKCGGRVKEAKLTFVRCPEHILTNATNSSL